jgi:hypothetical protein
MRIKLYENFINEYGVRMGSAQKQPTILDSFTEAEGKLSGKKGIVLSGITGDVTDIEKVIEKIPHVESFILITDQSSHVASSWKSDVFLLGDDTEKFFLEGTYKPFDTLKDTAMTIKQYFNSNEALHETIGRFPLLDEVVENMSDQVAKLINDKAVEIKNDADNKDLLKKMPYVAKYILEEVIKNLQERV